MIKRLEEVNTPQARAGELSLPYSADCLRRP